jgi:hypothetical protein
MNEYDASERLYGDISIHTFCISKKMSYKDYSDLYGWLKELHDENPLKESAAYLPKSHAAIQVEKGIRIKLSNSGKICNAQFIIDPLLVVCKEETDYKKIMPYDKKFFWDMINAVNDFFMHWDIPLTFDECSLVRVDLCMNLEMGKDFDIPKFIHYLRLTPCNEEYRQELFGQAEAEEIFYKAANTKEALVVYAKSLQQQRCYEVRDDGSNIMRIELQQFNKRLIDYRNIIKEKTGRDISTSELLEFVLDSAPDLMEWQVDRILPTGAYINDAELNMEMMMATGKYRMNTLMKVHDLMREVNSSFRGNAIWEREHYQSVLDWSDRKYRKVMNILNDLEIAPVTLAQDDCVERIESLSKMVKIGKDLFLKKQMFASDGQK